MNFKMKIKLYMLFSPFVPLVLKKYLLNNNEELALRACQKNPYMFLNIAHPTKAHIWTVIQKDKYMISLVSEEFQDADMHRYCIKKYYGMHESCKGLQKETLIKAYNQASRSKKEGFYHDVPKLLQAYLLKKGHIEHWMVMNVVADAAGDMCDDYSNPQPDYEKVAIEILDDDIKTIDLIHFDKNAKDFLRDFAIENGHLYDANDMKELTHHYHNIIKAHPNYNKTASMLLDEILSGSI